MSETADLLQAFLARIPYVRFLGMRAELAGDELTAVLPFRPELIGNFATPALHGGVLSAFMEMTALAQIALVQGVSRTPKTVDLGLEYLRPGRPVETYARAELRKVGRRIANVHVDAWQESRAQPIASLRGHFLFPED